MQDKKFEQFVAAFEALCIEYAVTQMHVLRAMTRIFNGEGRRSKKKS